MIRVDGIKVLASELEKGAVKTELLKAKLAQKLKLKPTCRPSVTRIVIKITTKRGISNSLSKLNAPARDSIIESLLKSLEEVKFLLNKSNILINESLLIYK